MYIIISFCIQNRNYKCFIKTYKGIFKYILNNLMINTIHTDMFELYK